jgi:hypothetical protein
VEEVWESIFPDSAERRPPSEGYDSSGQAGTLAEHNNDLGYVLETAEEEFH